MGGIVERNFSEELVEFPLFWIVAWATLDHQVGQGLAQKVDRVVVEIVAIDNINSSLVDDLSLLVHHLVIFKNFFSGLSISALNRVLCAFDRFCDHLGLDGDIFWECSIHDPANGATGKEPQEVIFK